MQRLTPLLVIAAALSGSNATFAGDLGHWRSLFHLPWGYPLCHPGCCPDDYCPKMLPRVPRMPHGDCNDYDRKCPPPLPPSAPPGDCNDYDRKPLPPAVCPDLGPHATCAPPDLHSWGRPRHWLFGH